jgi:hypothetical protein
MGIALPEEVTVYTVEARDIETFHEGCTPEIEAAIPELTDMLVKELQSMFSDLSQTNVDSHKVKQPILDTTPMEFV